MYKPSKEDIMFAKAVNDKLVATQTYEPNDMREAYRRLFGEEAPNQHFARSKVFTYFQYTYKAVDETETTLTKSGESDNETDAETIKVNYTREWVRYNPQMISGFHAEDNEGQSHEEDAKVYYDNDGNILGAEVKIGDEIHVIGAPSKECPSIDDEVAEMEKITEMTEKPKRQRKTKKTDE